MPYSGDYYASNNQQMTPEEYWYSNLGWEGRDPRTPGLRRRGADEARKDRRMSEEEMFMAMFGDGSFHSGGIGGVDRQFTGGQMREYQGIGDAGYNMGRGMTSGDRASKQGGFAPSSIYNMDPNYERYMTKSVDWDTNSPNAWRMYQSPYNADRWGDYLPGSREERMSVLEKARQRGFNVPSFGRP